MTANQLAILLAVYRGMDTALAAEKGRANYDSDVAVLIGASLLQRHPSRTLDDTAAGRTYVRKILQAATGP